MVPVATAKNKPLHKKGLDLQRQGRHEEAVRYFDKAIRSEPGNTEIVYDRAVSLQMDSKFEEAIKSYDAVLRSDPDNFAALVNKGLCLANPSVSHQEEALLCFEDALRVQPRDPGVLSLRGYTLDSLGRYREAIMCFDLVLGQRPGDLDVMVNKGLSLMHLGKYDEAIAYFDRVLDDEPGNLFATEWKKDAERIRDREFAS